MFRLFRLTSRSTVIAGRASVFRAQQAPQNVKSKNDAAPKTVESEVANSDSFGFPFFRIPGDHKDDIW